MDGISEEYILKPKDIYKRLDDYVIGQDEAKRAISVLAWKIELSILGYPVPKSNLLLMGPTGSGKTHIIKTLSRILNVPFASCDASSLTGAGFRGEDVEQVLERLIIDANDDVKVAEHGIIFIDEFDKLVKTRNSDDASLFIVQSELLKMVEGEVIDLNDHGKPSANRKKPIINTENITFVFAGAFSELSNDNEHITGFKVYDTSKDCDDTPKIIDDIIKYGVMNELAGRIDRIISFDKLSVADLKDVLLNSKDSIIKKYEELLQSIEISFEIEQDALDFIAQRAYSSNTGAGGLKGIIEKIIEKALYDIPSDDAITKVLVDKDSLTTGEARLIRESFNREC